MLVTGNTVNTDILHQSEISQQAMSAPQVQCMFESQIRVTFLCSIGFADITPCGITVTIVKLVLIECLGDRTGFL